MRGIYVADVGDGLCMAIHTIFGEVAQIDCGGQKDIVAFSGLKRIFSHFSGSDAFTLSHFHIDHYNGLLYASINRFRYPPFRVRDVYYPRIPEFKDKEKLLLYLFTMNLVLFGSETGVMAYDLLQTITRINNGVKPNARPRSKGESINIGGSVFEVLWPPAKICDDRILFDIKQALMDFEKALEEDEETRRLYSRVKDEGIFENYLSEQDERNEFESYGEKYAFEKCKRRRLPEVVEKANKSLRKAANHLGLAFFEDNRLLFLGDTEKFEIKQIVDDLKSKGRENFYILVTPHHGTHWHESLKQIRCIYSISSNGSELCSKFKSQFKEIAQRSLATFVNGDVMIPMYL
jgi:ribonuclease BN (tRNA processing enzyme)